MIYIMNAIEFKGIMHYPKGNANLSVEGETLVVSNMAEPMNGLIIRTNCATNWQMNFEPVDVSDKIIGATFNILDKLDRVKSVAQWALKTSPCGRYVYLYINSKLEGDTIEVVGMKDCIEVFRRVYDNHNCKDCNWWVVAVAAAIYIINKIDYETETYTEVITNPDGTITKKETTRTKKSFGSSSNAGTAQIQAVKSPSPINPDLEDEVYDIDLLNVISSQCYSEEVSNELSGNICEVIITAQTNNNIVIIDEQYNS